MDLTSLTPEQARNRIRTVVLIESLLASVPFVVATSLGVVLGWDRWVTTGNDLVALALVGGMAWIGWAGSMVGTVLRNAGALYLVNGQVMISSIPEIGETQSFRHRGRMNLLVNLVSRWRVHRFEVNDEERSRELFVVLTSAEANVLLEK